MLLGQLKAVRNVGTFEKLKLGAMCMTDEAACIVGLYLVFAK